MALWSKTSDEPWRIGIPDCLFEDNAQSSHGNSAYYTSTPQKFNIRYDSSSDYREQMIRIVVASQAKRKKLTTMIGKRFSDVGEPS